MIADTVTFKVGTSAATGPMPIPSWMYRTRRSRRYLARRGPRRFRAMTMQALLQMRFGAVLSRVSVSDLAKKVRIL